MNPGLSSFVTRETTALALGISYLNLASSTWSFERWVVALFAKISRINWNLSMTWHLQISEILKSCVVESLL
jgi:hypothetical protein